MKVRAKLYDPNEGNRDYKFTAEAFELFNQYMKKSDRIVYDGQEMDELELTHPSLNDAVGKVESIEWVDSCAFGEIELIDTPKGKCYQDLLRLSDVPISISPVWSYRKVGDKILDLQLKDVVVLPVLKEKDDRIKNPDSETHNT